MSTEEQKYEQFLNFHSGYYGVKFDNIKQLTGICFDGKELMNYVNAFALKTINVKDKEIQTEDIVDIINENYGKFTGTNEGVLHAAEDIIELFKSKQIEPDFQKVLHETVFENMRDKPLKNRIGKLDKDKMTENLENMIGNLSLPIVLPTNPIYKTLSAEQHLVSINAKDIYGWDDSDSYYFSDIMESYANLCVEQAKVEWEKEKYEFAAKEVSKAIQVMSNKKY